VDYAGSGTTQYWESEGKSLGYRGTVCGMRWGALLCFRPTNFLGAFSSADSKCYILAWSARKRKGTFHQTYCEWWGNSWNFGLRKVAGKFSLPRRRPCSPLPHYTSYSKVIGVDGYGMTEVGMCGEGGVGVACPPPRGLASGGLP